MRDACHIPRLSGWMFLLLMAHVISSCTENETKPLDKAYLESDQYTDFKERTTSEIEQKKELANTFSLQFNQFADCKAKSLPLPLELDSQSVVILSNSISDDCVVESRGQRLKFLGETEGTAQNIRWLMLDHETAYRDQELIAVTFRDGEYQSFETVGVFQKNVSRKVFSKIMVRNERGKIRITSRTERNIMYPIEQSSTVTTEFQIDTEGSIRQLK